MQIVISETFFHFRFFMRSSKIDKVSISKEFSRILRHAAADTPGISMRSDGFVELDQLLALPFFRRNAVDMTFVRELVSNDEKSRFSLVNENGTLLIRANQGHSTKIASLLDVNEILEPIVSPADIPKVVHGTTLEAWSQYIQTQGLKPMRRSHIHFAPGVLGEDGVRSGMRKSSGVYIYINAERAMAAGIKFFRSANNVILSDGLDGVISPEFFEKVVDAKSGRTVS